MGRRPLVAARAAFFGLMFLSVILSFATARAAADPNADSFLVVPRVMRMNTDTGRLKIEKVGVEFEAR